MQRRRAFAGLLTTIRLEMHTVPTLNQIKRTILQQLQSDQACADNEGRPANESTPMTHVPGNGDK